ncbi:aspartic peptidase A1 [Trametes gibbosa]|nr:aspartic peptidase A1 [Trametes gibbosa]
MHVKVYSPPHLRLTVVCDTWVDIGMPPTRYSLFVGTGSSHTWVGAGRPYKRSSTSKKTQDSVFEYLSGNEFTDNVSLGAGLISIHGQSIGVATSTGGFDNVDGVLGYVILLNLVTGCPTSLGPVDLTIGILASYILLSIPTVTDNLFSQGVIQDNLVAFSFEPTALSSSPKGELTFSGTDSSKFTGPLTRACPASGFWRIDQSIRYGESMQMLSSTAGIVDTGSTSILIASDTFQRYMHVTGAMLNYTTGLLRITPAELARLQILFFHINGVSTRRLRVCTQRPDLPNTSPQSYPMRLLIRALNAAVGGDPNIIYLVVGDIGTPSGDGFDFMEGKTWLEHFYTVFDTNNRRFGIVNTPSTASTIN